MLNAVKEEKVCGIPLPWFAFFFVVVVVGIMTDSFPNKMMSGFTISIVLGIGLDYIGNKIPVFKSIGGGAILAVIVPALFLYLGILPESARVIEKNFFTSGYDFLTLMVPSLMIGSIFGLNREVMKKVGVKFIVPIFATIFVTILVMGLLGHITGYGFRETIMLIAGPIMGAGVGQGAVPMSQIYAAKTGKTADEYIGIMTAAVLIANIMTIVLAAMLGSMGRRNPNMFFKGFSGEGKIARSKPNADGKVLDEAEKPINDASFKELSIGFVIICGLNAIGFILSHFFTFFHLYIWLIIIAIIFKVFRLGGDLIEEAANKWNKLVTTVFVPGCLVLISMAALDLNQLGGIMSDARFLSLVVICVLLTVVVAGAAGYFMGLYFVETSIFAGIGLSDMGGTGDVAVLAAANRMGLMPYISISSRLGGGAVLILMTLMVNFFGI
jgi:Na+/citrate or Na+/malate symporter